MRQVVAYQRIKTLGNHQAQKVVAVAYRRWSFTRGSNCKALTGKILVFWIGGRLWDVVAYESWSHMEVRLHFTLQPNSLYCAVRLANFEGILGFSVASIIVTELVGSICLLLIGAFRSTLFVSVFQG